MDKLKLLWLEPEVQFPGKGIMSAWREEMALQEWDFTTEVGDCDCVIFGSDSQLKEEYLGKKPTILYFWGWMPSRLLDRTFQQFAQKQLHMMAKCTRILVPSMTVMDQAANFGLPSQLCLPGVDAKTLNYSEVDIREPLEDKPQVMFLSRLAPQKGLEVLMNALSLLEPTPRLLVSGSGENKPYVKLAEELHLPSCEFTQLDDPHKVLELRKSEVLVHPSAFEGFGLPPLEALYVGTPVIVFDIPQMRWLLQEDAYYFSSIEGLAQAIVYVLEHPHEAKVKAIHGGERIRKSLTLEHACGRLWAHIHQTIKEHLAMELREKPEEWSRIYDDEHRRNWAYSVDRFDPTWERHWRAQAMIGALEECGAKYVLDVGCGTVYPTILARAGFDVTALDVSPECIAQVINIGKKWGVMDRIHPVVGDANHISGKDGSFDAVIQAEIWEHVPDVVRVIGEGLRVLKPGGYLIATTPIGEHHFDFMHLRVFDDKGIEDLMQEIQGRGLAKVFKVEKIAEQGTDPSCYLVVMKKL